MASPLWFARACCQLELGVGELGSSARDGVGAAHAAVAAADHLVAGGTEALDAGLAVVDRAAGAAVAATVQVEEGEGGYTHV